MKREFETGTLHSDGEKKHNKWGIGCGGTGCKIEKLTYAKFRLDSGNVVAVRDDGFTVWLPDGEVKSCSWRDYFAVNRAIRIVAGGKK